MILFMGESISEVFKRHQNVVGFLLLGFQIQEIRPVVQQWNLVIHSIGSNLQFPLAHKKFSYYGVLVGVLGPAGPQPTSESVLRAPNHGW